MTTLAEQIEHYLVKHPRKVISVIRMFDDLGIYTVNTSTGHKSYTPGADPMRRLLYGAPPNSKVPAGTPPMEGLALVTKVASNRGNKAGLEWARCTVRYTPPKTADPVTSTTEPEQDPLPVEYQEAFAPADALEATAILARVGLNVATILGKTTELNEKAGYHNVLLVNSVDTLEAILAEQKKTNALMERLLQEWGATTTS